MSRLVYYSYYCYCYCIFLLSKIYQFIYYVQFFTQIEDKPIVKTDIEKYNENSKARFINTYTKTNVDFNSNIDPLFYSKKEFQELLKDVNNPFEKVWKTRILYESTPRGNVIMYYDIYKQGFAYYSDQSISYVLLNSAAMKYSINFRCRDFFMDDTEVPEEYVSPLIQIQKDEDIAEIEKNKKKMESHLPNLKNARFAKLKNYSKMESTKDLTKTDSTKTDSTKKDPKTDNKPDKIYSKNKFIYLGKTSDISFIQKAPNKHILNTTTKYDALFTNVDTAKLDYKTFKLRAKESKEATDKLENKD